MRVIVQVVKKSSVEINVQNTLNEIGYGLNLLVGFTHSDDKKIVDALVKKIVNLRIFIDENDKMNLSIKDVAGEILSISQFTLYGDVRKGNRPGFTDAMNPTEAIELYDYFNRGLESNGIVVKTGEFGADMLVRIDNYGPTTIILDSDEIVKK